MDGASQQGQDGQQRGAAWFGLVFMAAGAAMMTAMAVDQTGLNAPLYVAEAAAFCFVLAGASIIAQSFGWRRVSRACGLGVAYGLAVPPFWIAFGVGDRSCTATGMFLTRIAADLECRGVFAVSAVATILIAVTLTWAVLTGRAKAA